MSRIQVAREEAKLTQAQAAVGCNLTLARFRKIEAQPKLVTLEEALILAEYFQLEPEEFTKGIW